MQTMPPVFVAPQPVIDRPQAVNEIKPPSAAGGSALNGDADSRDARLADERARQIARLIGNRDIDEDQVLIPGLLALDTREVGDQDIIDPNRPAVRGPEPLSTAEVPEDLPPLPDEIEPTGEVREEGEVAEALPGSPEAEAKPEMPEIGPQSKAPDQGLPGQSPRAGAGAQPASPGASAPDVPEPPEPGNIDIRR